jgi:pimeloyl-ACP methyl ester carboxylesterase
MAPLERRISTWDGFSLRVLEWGGGESMPLLCQPGLVRTAEDFSEFAGFHGGERRIVAIDYLGRGDSSYAPKIDRYAPEACLRDVLDVCAALHLHRVGVVGTSFGGLLGMGIAAMRPGLLGGLVLNDIGPGIEDGGTAFVRDFVGHDPALPDLQAAADYLAANLPFLSLRGEAQWRRFAELTYAPAADGRYRPRWDTRIADLVTPPDRDLWPLFSAIPEVPLLLLHGLESSILSTATVRRMAALRPDMAVLELAGVGHTPTLVEPESVAAVAGWMARL